MALPSSGPISISQIRTELGTSNGSLRYLSSLAGFSTPDSMSEFYGYSAGANIEFEYYAVSGGYQYANIYYNGSSNYEYSSRVMGTTALSPAAQTIYVEAYDSTSNGVSIDYYINGVYQTQYNSSSYTSTGGIGTLSGNTYRFIIYTGAIG